MTLTASNTYTGATLITGGTLQVGNGGRGASIGATSGVSMANNAALVFNEADNSTFSAAISGGGSLTKVGSGTLTLTAANTYTGATVVQAGTLKLGGNLALPAAAGTPEFWLDASNATTLTTTGNNVVTQWNSVNDSYQYAVSAGTGSGATLVSNALNGRPVVNFGAWGSDNWMQLVTPLSDMRTVFWVLGSQNGGGWLLGDGGSYPYCRGGAGTGGGTANSPLWDSTYSDPNVKNGATYINGQAVNGTTTGLSGGYQLVDIVTAGNTAANALAAGNSIPARTGGQQLGELIVYNTALTDAQRQAVEQYLDIKWFGEGPLPASSPLSLASGATLDLGGLSQAIGSLSNFNGSGGTVTNSGGYASTLTVGNDGTSTTFSGLISDGANTVALTKTGGGTLTLTSANSYSGGTTISGGILNINADAALGAAAGAVTFAANGTLQAGASGIVLNSSRTININGGVAATFDTQGYSMTVAGGINGSGSLAEVGGGTLILSGNNAYAGPTTVNAGTLQIGNGTAARASRAASR